MIRYARKLARALATALRPRTHVPRHSVTPRAAAHGAAPTRGRLTVTSPDGDAPNVYWTRQPYRLLPAEIRRKRFSRTRIGRRGLDPVEVRAFLNRIADEMNALYEDLAVAQEHTARLRRALRARGAYGPGHAGDDHRGHVIHPGWPGPAGSPYPATRFIERHVPQRGSA